MAVSLPVLRWTAGHGDIPDGGGEGAAIPGALFALLVRDKLGLLVGAGCCEGMEHPRGRADAGGAGQMKDYVSREAALDRIVGYDFQQCPDYMEDWATELKHAVICDLKDAVETLPAADVAPVVHAEWKINADGYYPYCSACKKEPPGRCMTAYCPNCGAKMDVGGEAQG